MPRESPRGFRSWGEMAKANLFGEPEIRFGRRFDDVKGEVRGLAVRVGGSARDLASSARDLAERVGPRRGLIGLAVLSGAIIGAAFLVRYLRNREEGIEEELEAGEEALEGDARQRRMRRRARRVNVGVERAGIIE
jgi:hypothetical protein